MMKPQNHWMVEENGSKSPDHSLVRDREDGDVVPCLVAGSFQVTPDLISCNSAINACEVASEWAAALACFKAG